MLVATASKMRGQLPAPRGILLFIATPGLISKSLLQAVRYEFPDLIVKQVEQIAAGCLEFGHPVALILVDASFAVRGGTFGTGLARCASAGVCRRHRAARRGTGEYPETLGSRLVRGVLPMNVTLDVGRCQLSRLLLHGGDYFPLYFALLLLMQKLKTEGGNLVLIGDACCAATPFR